jgi:hypothetical protein
VRYQAGITSILGPLTACCSHSAADSCVYATTELVLKILSAWRRTRACRPLYVLKPSYPQPPAPQPARAGGPRRQLSLLQQSIVAMPALQPDLPRGAICGINFSLGSHLAVMYASGSIAVLQLRPHASGNASPDDTLAPVVMLALQPPAMIGSGALVPMHNICKAHPSLPNACLCLSCAML